MVEAMDAVFTILLLVTLANFTLAGFVLWHKSQAETNRVFALTALSAALWTFTNALFLHTNSIAVATAASQFSYLAAAILGASFLHFAWVFPLRRNISVAGKFSLWMTAAAIGLLSFVPGAVIRSVDLASNHSLETTTGVYAITLFMLITTLWAFGTFAWRHTALHRVAREQSRWVLTGSALTASIGLTCNLFLPLLGHYVLVWLGPVSTLFFVGFSIYAIVAHHLFDIRLIIKRTLVYSLLVAAIGAGYSGIEHLLTQTLQEATQNSQYSWLASIAGALVVSLFAAPLRHWLEKQLSRIIYHREHNEKKHPSRHRSAPQAATPHKL
jgi:uncharacterized protein YacL